MTKKKATREDWEKKVKELTDMLENVSDDFSKSDAAEYACVEIVIWAAYCHYHGIGILEEAKLEYRELSLNALNEEDSSN